MQAETQVQRLPPVRHGANDVEICRKQSTDYFQNLRVVVGEKHFRLSIDAPAILARLLEESACHSE